MAALAPAPAPGPPAATGWYRRTPLFVRILVALVIGIAVGRGWGPDAQKLSWFSDTVLQLLALLATPLIFIAVVQALVKAKAGGGTAGRLAYFLLTNTLVAILVGLLVANLLKPGTWRREKGIDPTQLSAFWVKIRHLSGRADDPFHLFSGALRSAMPEDSAIHREPYDAAKEFRDKIPKNFVEGFLKNDILQIIVIAIAFGIALRVVRARQVAAGEQSYKTVEGLLDTGFETVMVMLHWIFELVPFAVFAVVAKTVGVKGFTPLLQMGGFVLAVLLALFLQALFYLGRLRLGSWVRPGHFLRGASDALALAFSTASSAATLPVTYACMKDKVGVREESASLGVMVGGTFNHDGTALYEAMAALFMGQLLGMHLPLGQQVVVVLMSVVASVGAAGIPEAGLVTMLAVFKAVNLPIEYVPLLLPVDWFLDRVRTAINVMGDMSVTCLLDGRTRAGAN